jgi:hypothetical protein
MIPAPPKRGRPIGTVFDNPASSWIQIRVTPKRKAAYVRAARPGKLTAWITAKLDAAAGYSPEGP